jgi:hypothetical protein
MYIIENIWERTNCIVISPIVLFSFTVMEAFHILGQGKEKVMMIITNDEKY